MFEATAACDKYTSSVLHTAKLVVFHLTKPKKGLLSLLKNIAGGPAYAGEILPFP